MDDVTTLRGDRTAEDSRAVEGRATDGGDRYLTLRLGGEVFAVGILDVTEIIEYRSLTQVPMMPPFVRGVLNLRGRVVPVVDLAARFGRGSTQIGRRTAIIIVETARPGQDGGRSTQDFGIIVDAVNEVVHFGVEDVEPPPEFGGGIRSDFISGMAKHRDGFIIVLDVSRVLSVDEIVELGRVAADGRAATTPTDEAVPEAAGAGCR